MITQERLKQLLEYNPDTGLWKWRVRRQGVVAEKPVGTIRSDGYRFLFVDRKSYKASRMAYLYMTGGFPPPPFRVDHRNGVRADDRWCNLRLATESQNQANRKVTRKGLKGASFHKISGKWLACIKGDGKYVYLGLHKTEKDAHEAYCRAAVSYHGEFARFL